jgi:hypothetical protein
MPAPKISMEYLFSRPNPARIPNQIQSFWLPVFTIRMTSQAQPIQNSGSNAFMDSKLPVARIPGATSVARAAEALGKPLAAQLAGDQGGEDYLARCGHGRQETDRRE